ncbi:MAG: hypothetical protein IJC43_01695, partial [Clostridia bacterium]|nr:hypothetical protein [Clostridia bacterium]
FFFRRGFGGVLAGVSAGATGGWVRKSAVTAAVLPPSQKNNQKIRKNPRGLIEKIPEFVII